MNSAILNLCKAIPVVIANPAALPTVLPAAVAVGTAYGIKKIYEWIKES